MKFAHSEMMHRVVMLVTVGFATLAQAQEPGKLPPLPDKLGPSIERRVGKVDFKKGLPTRKGIEQLFDFQDFQRATPLYQGPLQRLGPGPKHPVSWTDGSRH